ncbi:MAG: LptF/LptG family permease [Sumerlaeia bacterium]
MNLIDREFLGDFFRAFVMILVFITFIILIETILDFTDKIFGGVDFGAYWLFLYFLCSLPGKLVLVVSFAVAASVLWVVMTKSRNNEILAYLAGGLSPQRLSLPFLIGAFLVSLGAIGINETLVAKAERKAVIIEKVRLQERDMSAITRNENIYQRGADRRLYIIEAYDSANEVMKSPVLIDLQPRTHLPEWELRAETGSYVDRADYTGWEFQNASIRKFDTSGRPVSFTLHERLREPELEARKMEVNLRLLLSKFDDPDAMNFLQLREYIRLMEAQKKDTAEFRTRLHSKLVLPLASFVIALLMCGHIMKPRSQGFVYSLGGGLIWVVAFYLVMIGCRQLAEYGSGIPVAPLVWFPNVVFGIIGAFKLLKGS